MTRLLLLVENLFFPIGALAVALKFLFSPRKNALKPLWDELPERFGRVQIKTLTSARGRVWLHCASAGEVNAAAGLTQALAGRGAEVILTTMTAAGRQRAQAIPGFSAVSLAPLDFGPSVSAFLDRAKPRALILVETELWPQMLALSMRRGMVCAVVNARMTERSFRRYRLISWALRPLLGQLALVAAQTDADAERFRALGARRVEVVGNMKHDLPGAGEAGDDARAAFAELGWGGCPVFCAGSTHPVEEEAVLRAFSEAKKQVPALKLVIAPRHAERAGECAAALEKRGVSFCRWSARRAGAEAVLVDGLGVLGQLYALSTVAFVGGTLVPVGGHNLLEPALAGIPVLFGPHTSHQAESAQRLESAGAGFRVEDERSLATLLSDLLSDPKRCRELGALARRTAQALQGALTLTEELLLPLLRLW